MFRRSPLILASALVALTALVIGACGGDDGKVILALSFSGVEPLVNGYHYEGWAIIDGKPVGTGKFNVDSNGRLIDLDGRLIENGEFDTGIDLSDTAAIVLTIEPSGDTDTISASTHYVASDVFGLVANLTVYHRSALDDYFWALGTYILATPSDGGVTNEMSGIWFLDVSTGVPSQALELPTLPDGWQHEGWVVIEGKPVTTGRFTDPAAADLSAPFSGTVDIPPFPGEDFLQNAPSGLSFPTDIRGSKTFISIEPEPDDSEAPFTLKPLVGDIPGNAEDRVTYELGNNSGGFPTGRAVIR